MDGSSSLFSAKKQICADPVLFPAAAADAVDLIPDGGQAGGLNVHKQHIFPDEMLFKGRQAVCRKGIAKNFH